MKIVNCIFGYIIDIGLQEDVFVRVIKCNPLCWVCNEHLACNNTKY